METIKVKITRIAGAGDLPLPEYQSRHAAGMDIYAAVPEPAAIAPGKIVLVPTGLAISLPAG